MTDLMTLLFDHAMDSGFTSRLNTAEYRELSDLTDRLSRSLRAQLPLGSEETLEKYHDALEERHDLELEAMFLSAFDLARELR